MNSLEMYKKLPKEDKSRLTIYCIFDSIYDVQKNENISIADDVVLEIQELSYDLYLDDENCNLSASQIAYFLTSCYVRDENFLNRINDYNYSDIIQAIVNDNYDFYETEMER